MPPHCDSLDGPVVRAARRALQSGDVDAVLPFVPKSAEQEVRQTFTAVAGVRDGDAAVRDVADRHFFETVVRLHRAGEGAAFAGLKPAGLDHGPVIPVAERAIDTGSADELVALLTGRVGDEVRARLSHVMELKAGAGDGVDAARAYVQAMLGLQVWAHGLFTATTAPAHGESRPGAKPHAH